MAQQRVIDTLVTRFVFQGDSRDVDKMNRKVAEFDRKVQSVARGIRVGFTAAIGIGGAAFFTGSKAEREFVKLQTQLGDTREQVEAIRPQLRSLSKDTGEPLEKLAAAFFNLKSSVQGISDEAALEVITASAKGASIELGNVDALALVAGVAIRQFGEDTLSGQQALDVLHATIRSGTIPDAGALASNFGRLLGPGKELNLTFEELAASVAGYSQSGQPIPTVIDAIRASLVQLNAPSGEAQKVLDRIFPGATDSVKELREMIGRDGLLQTLQFLRKELGEDTQSLRRLVGDVNALGFILDATGDLAGNYTDALEANRNALGSVNKGFELVSQTGAQQAKIATNNLKLALESFYRTAVGPLLQVFGRLPSAIQTVILSMAGLSIASSVLGGPSLGAAIRGMGGFIQSLKTGTFWQSNFIIRLRLAVISVTDFARKLWTRAVTALSGFATSVRTNAIPALSRFATTIWTSTIGALRALGRRLAMASLAMLRFATRAIVAGISAVITFGAAIWASLIPPLIAATAAVVGFTIALLANPIVLIVMAIIGAFVALGFVVYKFRRQIVGALKFAWNWIKGNWPLLMGILLGPFGIVGALIWKFRDDIVDAFLSIRDFFMGIWVTIVGIFRDHWAKILAVIFPPVGLPMLIAQEWAQIVGFVGDIWNRVYDTVKGWIEAIISFVRELPGRVVGILKDIPGMVADAIRDIPGLGGAIKVFTEIADRIPFAKGGIVPGPLGRPLLATVHGGEMVLPVGASRVIAQMLKGFQLGPAALPQAPPGYGQMYRSLVDNRTVTVHIHEPIVIHTEATDAKGIAQEIGEVIQDQIRNVAYDHDGPVER